MYINIYVKRVSNQIIVVESKKKMPNFNFLAGKGCFYVFVNGFVNGIFLVNEDSDKL